MKIVYNIVKSLRPHFFSLREIQDNVSLDIKIPNNWKYENLSDLSPDVPFSIKIQDKKEKNSLISLISPSTVDGYELVFNYAKIIINTNKEEEEKNRLFKEKVDELKKLFLSSPLDSLKGISFDEIKIHGLSDTESTGEIELGDEEGSGEDGQD